MARTVSQIYFLLTSISGIFMGMNCILFFFCVYVLWGQKSKSRRILLLTGTLQFFLCLAQVAIYITYLVIAFTVYPGGAENYFRRISGYSLACYIIYTINSAIEGILLTWRVYLLYNDVKFCIPLIVLLALQVALGGVTAQGFATEAFVTGRLRAFHLATWALIAAVNVSATILICIRLWIANRKTHPLLSRSKYKSTIIVVVECGCLVTICSVAMLILYSVQRSLSLAGVGITTQVATFAPLLIIARHGILSRRDDRRSIASRMPLRIAIVRTEDTRVDGQVERSRGRTRKSRLGKPSSTSTSTSASTSTSTSATATATTTTTTDAGTAVTADASTIAASTRTACPVSRGVDVKTSDAQGRVSC